ncbi:MAG TPA: MFS transporter [Burkholderiales bacterium]|jgi:MFS family permease|nr:MFS transporter [Burkholderiales bacterium]
MTEPSRAAPAQVAFAALRHGSFRAYFATSAAAMMADNVEHVISYWVMFQKFHSPALAGFAVLTHWLPFLLFSVYFGALADRYDCRRIIQFALLLFMGVSLAWGLLFLTDTIEMWHAMVLLTVHGMAGVIWGPASQLLIHDIVGSEELQSAIRLNATGRYLGLLMGPAVGGGLMLALGPPAGLLANALIYLPLFLWLWKIPNDGHRRQERGRQRRAAGLADTVALLREVSGNRTIFSMILLAGVSSLFVGNAFQAQMPEYAHDLGTDEAGVRYTILLGANAAGALAGGLVLESRGLLQARPQTAIVFTVLWCLVVTGFAAATNYPLAVALMFVAGFLNLAFSAMSQTLVQVHAPAQLRGRLIGLYNTANSGMRAFSGLTVGVLGSLIGVHWSLALSALALLAATLVLWAFSMRTN